MIIQRSELTLWASQVHEVRRTTQQTVRAWTGTRPRPDGAGPTAQAAQAAQAARVGRIPLDQKESGDLGHPGNAVEGRLARIVALIEWLTGEKVQVLDAADLAAGGHRPDDEVVARGSASPSPDPVRTPSGWGVEVTSTETTVEVEATAVAAAGSVTTTDGRRIDVAVDLRLRRELSQTTSTRIAAGDARVSDPLMLSLTGAVGLGTERAAFDLDGDGVDEQVPCAATGTAFLAVDRNGNGILDDGGELFGPATGDGFGELAAHDADGNGWIDEADPVFTRLGLATCPRGELTSLADQGIGAIGLARVASPFTFISGGRTSGVLRSTGVWLGENGSAGAVQQIDVAT